MLASFQFVYFMYIVLKVGKFKNKEEICLFNSRINSPETHVFICREGHHNDGNGSCIKSK